MQSPVTYQGGKTRLADQIIRAVDVPAIAPFYDVCCGSGAVTLALIRAGHPPNLITMIDAGPWGIVWELVGSGNFDLSAFEARCDALPEDPRHLKSIMEALYLYPVETKVEAAHVYLLLQAAAIGGKSISLENGRWVRGSGFRDYWLPTETSSRRSPVNPMMPMPKTIVSRMREIVVGAAGVTGIHADASSLEIPAGSVVYVDPPYAETTGYGHAIDVCPFARKAASQGCSVWVSEGKPLSDAAVLLSNGRAKGGITGQRKKAANEEWLSPFHTKSRGCGL